MSFVIADIFLLNLYLQTQNLSGIHHRLFNGPLALYSLLLLLAANDLYDDVGLITFEITWAD